MSDPEDVVDAEVLETAIVKAEDKPLEAQETVRWTWDKKKRLAFRMSLEGTPQVDIAKKLGVHRNTIRNWTRTREWLTELKNRIQEKQMSTKLRRLNMVDDLVDDLHDKAKEIINTDKPVHPGTAGVFIKEFREYVRTERELYGENMKGQASLQAPQQGALVNINVSDQGPVIVEASGMAFKDFVKQNTAAGETIEAESSQEAMIAKTRSLLTNTDLIDSLNEEDKAAEKVEAQRVDAKRR